jgi:hypothetical protein
MVEMAVQVEEAVWVDAAVMEAVGVAEEPADRSQSLIPLGLILLVLMLSIEAGFPVESVAAAREANLVSADRAERVATQRHPVSRLVARN